MRRPTDPKAGVVVSFMLGAVVLHLGALTGGSALVSGAGGLGLAEPSREAAADRSVDVDLETPPVVEIDRPAREAVPEKARFSSEWNSKVDRETAARHRGLEPKALAALEPPRSGSELTPPATAGSQRPPGATLEPRDPVPPIDPGRDGRAPTEPPPPGTTPTPPGQRKLSLRDLRPTDGKLRKAVPGAFPDHLKDVEEGDETLLNTKEFKFASFFNRVKRSVAQHWNPGREYERRDPKGNVYGFKSRLTVLLIVLTPEGAVKRIVLDQPSGLGFLDDEAIRAFRAGAPFPNPPRRLVDARTNEISFRFGFQFEILRGPSFRMFRMQ
jgi:TonB family protein